MKKTAILTALAAITILTSCAEVPENIVKEKEGREMAPEYVPENVRSNADNSTESAVISEDDVSKQSNIETGIKISCQPTQVNTDKFYILKSSLREDEPEGNMKVLCNAVKTVFGIEVDPDDRSVRDFWTEFDDSGNPIQQHELPGATIALENCSALYDNNGAGFFLGCVDFDVPEQLEDFGSYDYVRYTPDSIPPEKLTMLDGKQLSPADAVSRSDEYIKELKELGMFDENEELVLSAVYIADTGYGSMMNITYDRVHYGLPLDDGGFIAFPAVPEDGIEAESAMRSSCLRFFWGEAEHPMTVENLLDARFETKQEIKDILSFEEACQRLTSTLAENMDFTVNEAALKYCCYYTEGDTEFTYRPMWTFMLKEEQDRKGYLQYPRPRIMGYVDAVNGDVYYSDYEKHIIEMA